MKNTLFSLLTIFLSLLFVFIIGEIVLRIFSFPGVNFNNVKYDTAVGYGFYPGSKVIYNSAKGEHVEKKTNSLGYLDVEHQLAKAPGKYRIGFFGDSYVEARQVPLENTFFRLIDKSLEPKAETLAFGIGGYSTLQSYFNSQRWSKEANLDMVVYVFCENDVGDNIREIKGMEEIPYAKWENNKLVIDRSFIDSPAFKSKQALFSRTYKYFLSHSIFGSTIASRIWMLKGSGINIKLNENERKMSSAAAETKAKKYPNQNDLPSSWPQDIKDASLKIDEAIILSWKKEVEKDGKKFVILYIPREGQETAPMDKQDSWKPQLFSFAKKNNIMVIDPAMQFAKIQSEGKKIFYDHFTKDGHEAFAEAFIQWFRALNLDNYPSPQH